MAKQMHELLPTAYRALVMLEGAVRESAIPALTFELVKLRSSQINGCAFCIDMHYKDARAAGETEERLAMLPAWREATCYSAAERAALAVAEAVTRISEAHLPADVEAEAREHYDEEAFAALIFSVVAINAWNRVAISGHAEPGHYTPADRAAASV